MNMLIHVATMISLTKIQRDRWAKSSFKDAKHYSSSHKTAEVEPCGLEKNNLDHSLFKIASASTKCAYQEG